MSMNEKLHVTERIDKALNILETIPGLSGYVQWNPVCEAMRVIAGISQDIQKWEKDHPEQPEETEECEACKIHFVNEENSDEER